MNNAILSLDKILKSIYNSFSESSVFDNVFSCAADMLNISIVFIDSRNNIIKKSKCREINSLHFDFKNIFTNIYIKIFNEITKEEYSEYYIEKFYGVIMPVIYANHNMGALIVYSNKKLSDECKICLQSICIWLTGMMFAYEMDVERKKNESREIVKGAFGALSYSEFEAVIGIFKELDGREGILVMKKVSEKINVTRPVIVNALKKMESAGIIESRSLGVKGTYVKVQNKVFLEEIEKIIK